MARAYGIVTTLKIKFIILSLSVTGAKTCTYEIILLRLNDRLRAPSLQVYYKT